MGSTGFRTAIMDYIREQAKPVDKFSHQPRLNELTREIGAGQSYDDDVVFAAVWLPAWGCLWVTVRSTRLNSPHGTRSLTRWNARRTGCGNSAFPPRRFPPS